MIAYIPNPFSRKQCIQIGANFCVEMWLFAIMLQILVQYCDPVAVASGNFPASQRH